MLDSWNVIILVFKVKQITFVVTLMGKRYFACIKLSVLLTKYLVQDSESCKKAFGKKRT